MQKPNTVLYAHSPAYGRNDASFDKLEYTAEEMEEMFTPAEITKLANEGAVVKVGKYSTLTYISATALAIAALKRAVA
jgi:hypothetical protein